MSRNHHWMLLSSAVLIGAIGCEASEQRTAAPTNPKPPTPSAVEAKPQAEVAVPQTAETVEAKPGERIRDPAVKPAAVEEPATSENPQRQTAFFRLDANAPAVIPPVVLSKSHAALCKVKVGDVMPDMELPEVGGNQKKKLAGLFGKTATVVVFWKSDRRMSREALLDLGPDVVDPFGEKGVAVLGIAVNEKAASAKATLDKAGTRFTNLLDADGKAFAQVGSGRLPRVYLVDPAGKIVWFDIEYSQTTRRELHQALRAVTGEPATASGKKE